MKLNTQDAVEILVSIVNPGSQEFQVNIKWKPKNYSQLISLPVWTPGSYKVRDHSQFVYGITASQGNQLIEVEFSKTNQYLLSLESLKQVSLSYIVEARVQTVRTCYIDHIQASICLAACIYLVDGYRNNQHLLTYCIPSNWQGYCPLSSKGRTYTASNYDELIDAPLIAGNYQSDVFSLFSKQHRLLRLGDPPNGWPINFVKDVENICQAVCEIMKTPPPCNNEYLLVINLLEKSYGGLEHDNSFVIHYGWRSLNKPNGYRRLLQLIGHEYLHQWNVRRLRPIEYLTYDYDKAVTTDSLWLAEGVTSYFDLSIPLLAGLSSVNDFLEDLSEELTYILSSSGKNYHSISDSSRQAWIKLYNSNPSSRNTQVNYYRHGLVLSMCLDISLREYNYSLSQLLRCLWIKYGKTKLGYNRNNVKSELSNICLELSENLDRWLDCYDSLPLESCLSKVGIRLKQSSTQCVTSGLSVVEDNKSFIVQRIDKHSSASKADIIVDDVLIAINGFQIREIDDIESLLRDDQSNCLSFFRDGMLTNCSLIVEQGHEQKWTLSIVDSDHSCANLRSKWLTII